MTQVSSLQQLDVHVLLRIVGSRNGADLQSILAFEKSHKQQKATVEDIRAAVTRLIQAGHVVQRQDKYFGSDGLHQAFLDECRNCRDTIEEFDILSRIVGRGA